MRERGRLYDVVIVGGGPAGLYTAFRTAGAGLDTLLLEEHAEIGVPTHCTGIVSGETNRLYKIPEHIVLNRPSSCHVISPGGYIAELEDPGEELIGDPRTRVLDLDDHAALAALEPDAQGATGLHRVEGVADQIEKELLERRVVALDLRRVGPGCPTDRDTLLIETRLEQLDGVRDGRPQIERAVRASAGPGERPQPAGEVLHAPDLPPDNPGEFLPELLVQKLPR